MRSHGISVVKNTHAYGEVLSLTKEQYLTEWHAAFLRTFQSKVRSLLNCLLVTVRDAKPYYSATMTEYQLPFIVTSTDRGHEGSYNHPLSQIILITTERRS